MKIDKARLLEVLRKAEDYATRGQTDFMLPELQHDLKEMIKEVRESNDE